MSFLTTMGVDRSDLEALLDLADEFVEVLARPIPKVPALQGRTVANLFFENSTRTRLSFERGGEGPLRGRHELRRRRFVGLQR